MATSAHSSCLIVSGFTRNNGSVFETTELALT